jgi:DNA mismatch endonuclease (patch repair protein)
MPRRKIKNFLGRNLGKEREPDKISKKQRSSVMSKIRSRGTKFESDFIDKLKTKTRKRYRLNVKELKGKPDIVFDKYKVCVFLDSDFWHGWQYPRWKHLLKNDFWRNKIEANRTRDRRNTNRLRRSGWTVIRIWEHNIKKDADKEIDRILRALP